MVAKRVRQWSNLRRWTRYGWVACVLAAPAVVPAGASATGEPVMRLDEVRPGMACSVRSVLHGTAIERFDARVVDVVSGSVTGDGPRILVRVSGPAIDATGIGPGFSGSPISCAGADGVERTIGAISEGIGEETNHLVLATPIQAILAQPVSAPAHASAARVGPIRRLSGAWALSGASASVGQAVQAGAQMAGRTVLSAPAAPLGSFPTVDLQPGGAMAVALASGDLGLSAVGTVSYRDGQRIWGFGHPLDGVGTRSLPLQDAYVYDIVNMPGSMGGSYKLAAPGHIVGTLDEDALHGVSGSLGRLPRTIPLSITARDGDRGTATALHVNVADESRLDEPGGMSALRLVSAAGTAQAAVSALDGAPAKQSATLCLKLTLRGVPRPLGFCTSALADGGMPSTLAGQVDSALGLLDDNTFVRPRVTRVSVTMTLYRGLRQATLVGASGPRHARPGQRVTIRARVQQYRGPRQTLPLHVVIPRSAHPGRVMRITLAGTATPPDSASDGLAELLKEILGPEDTDRPVRSLTELAARMAAMGQYRGIVARVGHGVPARVYRSPVLQFVGRTRVALPIVAR